MDKKKKERGRIALKKKGRLTSRYNRYMYLIVSFFIVGYSLFFTSKYWMNDRGDIVAATQLLKSIPMRNRSVQLFQWNYSPTQRMMEIQVMIETTSYDGLDKYEVSALEKTKGFLDSEIVVNDEEFLVVHINNIPNKWEQMRLAISLVGSKDTSCVLYTNNIDVKTVEKIQKLSYNDYMTRYLDSLIESYKQTISNCKSDIKAQIKAIEQYKKQVEKYRAQEEFQTDMEKLVTEKKIQKINDSISNAEQAIEKDKSMITEYQDRIVLKNMKKDSIKKEDK